MYVSKIRTAENRVFNRVLLGLEFCRIQGEMYICIFSYLIICLISMECSIIILYGEEYCILVASGINHFSI